MSSCWIAFTVNRVPSDEEEDETAELLRELEKIKKERAEEQARKVSRPVYGCSRRILEAYSK